MASEANHESPFIEEIAPGGPCYREVLGWRDRILRRPLGLALTEADTAGEENQRHFILREGDALLAGVIAVPQEPGTMRLRQMWVRNNAAGQGRGRFLLASVEGIFQVEGFYLITLNARVAVRGFYKKCGYTAEGPEFEEVGIPHIRMTRAIANPPL